MFKRKEQNKQTPWRELGQMWPMARSGGKQKDMEAVGMKRVKSWGFVQMTLM